MVQALVELVRFSPDSALIAVCEHDGERFTVHEILAEAGGAKASFVLEGVLPFIPARLIDGNHLREPGLVLSDLRGAYAALRSRLSKLEIRRSAAFLGLQLAADAGLSLSLAIPELPGEPSSQGPVGLSATVDLTTTAGTLRGRMAFQIEVTAAGPKIGGAFGWPTFGFSFPKLDFGSLSLPDLRLTLPDMPAWLPGSKIVWLSSPVLRLDATASLSLFIDDGSNPGQPVAAAIEIEGAPLLAINAFQVMGRVDALTVTVQVSVSPVTTSIPDGQKSLGPVTVAWTNVQVDASLASQVLRVATRVPSLVVQGPTGLIEVSFDYVYQYDLVSGTASRDLQGFTVVQPTGGQIAQVVDCH